MRIYSVGGGGGGGVVAAGTYGRSVHQLKHHFGVSVVGLRWILLTVCNSHI